METVRRTSGTRGRERGTKTAERARDRAAARQRCGRDTVVDAHVDGCEEGRAGRYGDVLEAKSLTFRCPEPKGSDGERRRINLSLRGEREHGIAGIVVRLRREAGI